eukprot:CAMPEP_0182852268 /NCGR_PEP_ID=MMETSP0034_2-20130328/76_2 /TAXON_ID=156128 /ORGANISM="Nephroselmis pyriformis, Strain CCMP717" /LENGTH=31 /DNA_ID= /DNA_START= /DNA_END= /DNA_ORIENTATION=
MSRVTSVPAAHAEGKKRCVSAAPRALTSSLR